MTDVSGFIKEALHIGEGGKLTRKTFFAKFAGYIIFAVIVAVIYYLIRNDVIKDEGESFARSIITAIPFAKTLFPALLENTNSILDKTIEYSGEVKAVTEQFAAESVLVNLCKVLFLVWIEPLFDLLNDFFAGVRKYLKGTISAALSTPAIWLLKVIEFLLRFILLYFIFEPIKQALDSFDPTMGMVLALILFVLLFLLVGLVRTLVSKNPNERITAIIGYNAERGIVESFFVDVIPGLLEVFVSESLCLLLFYFWLTTPFGWRPVAFYIALLLWYCIIVPIFKALMELVGKHLPLWQSASVSMGQFVLWVLCSFATTILMYVMILINLGDTETAELLSLTSFPFAFSTQLGQTPYQQLTTYPTYFWPNLLTLIVICIVVALLLKKPLIRGLYGMALYVCIWAGVVLLASICTNILMNWLLAWDMDLDTNRYNGWYGIVFFILLLILLLYNYQLVVTAGFTAFFVVVAISAWMSSGQVNFAFMNYSDTRCMLAMMIVVFSMSALGAVTYGIRKK